MTEKCNPKYKNLNTIQSFSEQRYATVQWAEQNCQNDEWLKQQVEKLSYLTPPAVRKRYSQILVDDLNSWGYTINQFDEGDEIGFSNTISPPPIFIDFDDFSYIDEEKSDCEYEVYTTSDGVHNKRAVVPMVGSSSVNRDCKMRGGVNAYWYCGFDKNKNYTIRPDWIRNWLDGEIPTVCRAQTITIPDTITDGDYWESVDLQVGNHGTTNSNWGSPLYVRVVPVVKKKIVKTKWDNKKKQSVQVKDSKGKLVYETVDFPNSVYQNLGWDSIQPSKITPGWHNFRFNTPIKVNRGEKYAIVMSSPLSHWEHCPMIGGWGRNCDQDKYPGGDAFLSENNGVTWMKYGKNDESLTAKEYRLGRLTPVDFSFQVNIRHYSENRSNEEHTLYLKPIHSNPVKSITIYGEWYGSEPSENKADVVFEVSSTGRVNDWHALTNGVFNFSKGSNGEYPHIVFVRARMKRIDKSSATFTPHIDNISIQLNCDLPSEMYVRTKFYSPKTSPMLGASVWGRVYAPFEVEPTVSGSVELIPERVVSEHFHIISAVELENLTYINSDGELESVFDGLDAEKLAALPKKDDDYSERYQYLLDTPSAIRILKQNNYYVKPWVYEDDEGNVVREPMSFDDEGIVFDGCPAYPIQSAIMTPAQSDDAPLDSYAEWIDYTFDYDNDYLLFNSVLGISDDGLEEGAEILPTGTLEVVYNPVFIQDLSNIEVGRREDDEGLILDYFKETFIVDEVMISSRRIPLRVSPVDPVREVLLNDELLHEDWDFTVDYQSNELCFNIDDEDTVSSRLNLNDVVSVVYTPNLEDTGLCIGYRAKRGNKDKQIHIKPNYIEYKV